VLASQHRVRHYWSCSPITRAGNGYCGFGSLARQCVKREQAGTPKSKKKNNNKRRGRRLSLPTSLHVASPTAVPVALKIRWRPPCWPSHFRQVKESCRRLLIIISGLDGRRRGQCLLPPCETLSLSHWLSPIPLCNPS
jgi:hypothetical protein